MSEETTVGVDPKFEKARARANTVNTEASNDPRNSSFNLLLSGDPGSGKTSLLHTAPQPVHIDSFDPGGTKSLLKYRAKMDLITDTRFENEDPYKPDKFALWKRAFEERWIDGYWNYIGTYCLDSGSWWANAVMGFVQANSKERDKVVSRAGEPPNFYRDYNPQKILLRNWLQRILALPCNVIVTAHLAPVYEVRTMPDETQERHLVKYELMTTGDGRIIIPTMFDEWWNMDVRDSSKGNEYRILIGGKGKIPGKTRMGGMDQYEPADLKAIMKKVGLPNSDKARLT